MNVKVFNSLVCNKSNNEIFINKSNLTKNSTYGSNQIIMTTEKKNADKIKGAFSIARDLAEIATSYEKNASPKN